MVVVFQTQTSSIYPNLPRKPLIFRRNMLCIHLQLRSKKQTIKEPQNQKAFNFYIVIINQKMKTQSYSQ